METQLERSTAFIEFNQVVPSVLPSVYLVCIQASSTTMNTSPGSRSRSPTRRQTESFQVAPRGATLVRGVKWESVCTSPICSTTNVASSRQNTQKRFNNLTLRTYDLRGETLGMGGCVASSARETRHNCSELTCYFFRDAPIPIPLIGISVNPSIRYKIWTNTTTAILDVHGTTVWNVCLHFSETPSRKTYWWMLISNCTKLKVIVYCLMRYKVLSIGIGEQTKASASSLLFLWRNSHGA